MQLPATTGSHPEFQAFRLKDSTFPVLDPEDRRDIDQLIKKFYGRE
jgi:hypothetical protein